MGCSSSGEAYQTKSIDYSNRDIQQPNHALHSLKNELIFQACGYKFQVSHHQNQNENEIEKQKKQNSSINIQFLLSLYNQFQKSIKQSKIDKCNEYLKQLSYFYNAIQFKTSQSNIFGNWEDFGRRMKSMEEEYVFMKKIQKQFQKSQWKQITTIENITIKMSKVSNNIKVIASQYNYGAMDILIACFASHDKCAEIIKFVTFAKKIRQQMPFKSIIEFAHDYPFCEKDKKIYELSIYNRIQFERSVLICYRSLYENSRLCQKLNYYPSSSGHKEIDLKEMVCKISYNTDDKLKIQIYFDLQINLENIASWIIQKLCKNLAISTLKNLVKVSGLYGEETNNQLFENDNKIYQYFNNIFKEMKKK